MTETIMYLARVANTHTHSLSLSCTQFIRFKKKEKKKKNKNKKENNKQDKKLLLIDWSNNQSIVTFILYIAVRSIDIKSSINPTSFERAVT